MGAKQWLESSGFRLEKDAKRPAKVTLEATARGLSIRTKDHAFGVLANDRIKVERYARIRLIWGVEQYPEGASYAEGVNNEALMVYVFFGEESQSSGHLFVPDGPFFIGLYLCRNDTVRHAYKGKYYHKGGRFVCLDRPAPGESVVSELDLREAFRAYYGDGDVPPISGIALGFDTTDSGNGGRADAFIERIEFVE